MADVQVTGLETLDQLVPQFDTGLKNGIDKAAKGALDAKKEALQEGTYSREVRRLKSGKPAYNRTGHLKDQQQIVETGPFTREIRTVGDAEAYEAHVANLATGPDGINRSNDAAGKAHKVTQDRAARAVEQEVEYVTRN